MNSAKEKGFNNALIASIVLHLFIIGLCIFGIPSFYEKLPEEQQVITFEMLPLAEVVNVKSQTPKQPKAQEVERAKKVLKTKPAEPVKTPEKKEEPKKDSKQLKEEPPKPKEAEPVQAKKEPVTPPQKKAEEKKPVPKKEEKPKAKPKTEDSIDTLLKNLEEASEGDVVNSNKTALKTSTNEGKFAKSDSYTEDSPLSLTEQLFIRQQIERNWNQQRFLGIPGIEGVRISTFIKLNSKGEIIDAVIIKNYCPPNMADICQNVAESVLQAIWNSSPIENLVPSRYNVWGELNITFTPPAQ